MCIKHAAVRESASLLTTANRPQHTKAGTTDEGRRGQAAPSRTSQWNELNGESRRQIVVLIHWRIKPGPEHVDAFLEFWRTKCTVEDRSGLVSELLSETLAVRDFPYITWHMDTDALDDHKSFINVGTWEDENAFQEQVGKNFNDDKPMLSFEKYRRRRIVLRPQCWRIGHANVPVDDSGGVR